jgi:hypothetical protein
MGFFESATDKLISSNILKYTGQVFTPAFRCPVRSSVSSDWVGWVALDRNWLWLVNKYGARGVLVSNIFEYSKDSPTIIRVQTTTGNLFSIYPKTISGGYDLLNYLNFATDFSTRTNSSSRKVSSISAADDNSSVNSREVKIDKICDSCSKIVPMAYMECAFCKGTSFTHKKNFNYQSAIDNHSWEGDSFASLAVESASELPPLPLMKVCPMCAEDIKYAAKKCRYCGTMLDDQASR